MKKIKYFIKLTIFIVLITFPIAFYINIFNVELSNLSTEIGNYLDINNPQVVFIETLDEFEDKYLIAYFETDYYSGISLLSKGFNNKYQIRDAHYTHKEIICVDYDIEGEPYFIVYGKSDKIVSELKYELSATVIEEEINGNDIFIIKKGLFKWRKVELVYDDKTNQTTKAYISSSHRTSRSKATLPLFGSTVISFILIYTLIISSGKKMNMFQSDVLLDDDQRIKQFRPW